MCVAVRLVLEVLTHVAHAFHCGVGQGSRQVIRGEPTHVEAFLVTYERFGITIRIGLAHEQVIHIHGVVAVRIRKHLAGRLHRHQIGDDNIHASLFLDLTRHRVGRFLARLINAIHHGPLAGIGTPAKQHTTLLVFNIAGDAHQPQEIVTDFLA